MTQFSPINHITAKFINCDCDTLTNSKTLLNYLKDTLKNLNKDTIKDSFFILNPGGTTIVILSNNYELTLITNIINKNISINIFTTYLCPYFSPIFKDLAQFFKVDNYDVKTLETDNYNLNLSINDNLIQTKLRNKLKSKDLVISLLGSSGGVSKSILSILNKASADKNDPIYNFISTCKLHLVDKVQKGFKYYADHFPNLKNKITLHQFDVNRGESFKSHLSKTNTTIVIDISFADTVSTLQCCNELGVIYINSAFESVEVDENESFAGFSLQERYKIFENNRNCFKNTLAIICSGMNPGVVQWMAIELMKKYPDKTPNACYIVEDDTSFFEDKNLIDKDTIYTTWYPEGFLDEAIYSYPNFMKKHSSLFLYKEVYELEFKVTLGDKVFYGCLMPHEEAITLGKMYDMEIGFIYKINDHTTNLIKKNIKDLDSLWNKKMVVLDPEVSPLVGDDLVGILLVFDDTEAYMYNKLNNNYTYDKYGTNATYHQVACGLYGALSTILLDSIPKGIYYVDELLNYTNSNYGKYLSYHLQDFIFGENTKTDGDLLNRMKKLN